MIQDLIIVVVVVGIIALIVNASSKKTDKKKKLSAVSDEMIIHESKMKIQEKSRELCDLRNQVIDLKDNNKNLRDRLLMSRQDYDEDFYKTKVSNNTMECLRASAYGLFKDRPRPKDFSNLTPEQADRKIDRLKDEYGYLDDATYWGLKKISNGEYPIMEIPEDVKEGNPLTLFMWFKEKKDEGCHFSDKVWDYISKELKEYHEEILIKEMITVNPGNVVTWMSYMKRQGYFFSTKVYREMRKKWLSQFEES